MTDRPDISGVDAQTPAASEADVQSLAHDLRLRRRTERSAEDTAKTDAWLGAEAQKLGVTADHVEDVSMSAIINDVHSLPDF